MKYISYLLVASGFIGSALVATVHKEMVNWTYFITTMAIGITGVIVLRITVKRHLKGEEKVDADISNIEKSLANIVKNMITFSQDKEQINVYDIHEKIDEIFLDDLEAFLKVRESIIHQYDMQSYADLMNHFAAGERYLNRSWSASADGYVNESYTYIDKALEQFTIAQDHFNKLQSEPLKPAVE
jgi:hypothetical protein